MKKFIAIAALVALFMPSCQLVASPLMGGLYTNVQAPGPVTSNERGSKVGTAMAETWLGLWAEGDASVNSAATAGGITRISHWDYHAKSIWFIHGRFETFVYGD